MSLSQVLIDSSHKRQTHSRRVKGAANTRTPFILPSVVRKGKQAECLGATQAQINPDRSLTSLDC